MIKHLLKYLLVFTLAVDALAQPGSYPDAGDPIHRRGLLIDAGLGPQVPVFTPSSRTGGVFFMGAGYFITPWSTIALRVFTGSLHAQHEAIEPTGGSFAMGGGGVRVTFFLSEADTWRPYISGGFDLITVLDDQGQGYNGGGPSAGLGIQLNLSRHFALNGELQGSRRRFYNPVGDGFTGPFRQFSVGSVDVQISVAFYPGVMP